MDDAARLGAGGMTKKLFLDVLERAAWTAAQAFLAVYVVTDVSSAKAALVAAAGAVLAVLKGFVAGQVGEQDAALTPFKG